MRFVWFFISNVLLGWVFQYVFVAIVMALAFPAAVVSEKFKHIKWLFFTFLPFIVLAELFVILFWDAYLVSKTYHAVNHESVQYVWLYVIVAFLAATAPLRSMASDSDREAQLSGEKPSNNKSLGQIAFILFSAISFLVFYFYPPIMNASFGWFVNWWFSK